MTFFIDERRKTAILSGMSYTYQLIRSNRKTVSVEISRSLEIIVRAPRRMPKYVVDQFVTQHEAWIATHLEKQRQRAQAMPEPTEAEAQALRAQARAYIPGRVAHWATQMGVTPTAVKITSAHTRFGSCSAKNSLCFSFHLMRYPQAAIDYVVVHELAHITHKNHGKAFYALIAQYLPDFRERLALLKT